MIDAPGFNVWSRFRRATLPILTSFWLILPQLADAREPHPVSGRADKTVIPRYGMSVSRTYRANGQRLDFMPLPRAGQIVWMGQLKKSKNTDER